jgi:tetratricopeptide (TPR) repeat protein
VTRTILSRSAAGLLLAATALFPSALVAQGSAIAPASPSVPFITPQELSRISPAGTYLAARHAGLQRDAAAAAAYYRAALRADPRNFELLSQAFLSVLIDGDVDEAGRIAERLIQVNRTHRIARLALGVQAIKRKQYQNARQQFGQSVRDPITDLTAALLSAWTQAGSGDTRAATDAIDKLQGADWYAIFKDLHAGLILDMAGRKEAGQRLQKAHELDANAIRTVDAFGRWTSRNGSKEDALKIYENFDKVLPRHPLVIEAMDDIRDGQKLPPLVDSVQAGAAEVLYGLGASLGRQGGEDLGLVYLQLAVYLQPKHDLALLSLADLYENLKKPETAIKFYERVPKESPLRRNAEIQLAVNYDAVERTEEAKTSLNKLIAANPSDLEAIKALGDILRVRKSFAECAQVYSQGIASIAKPEKPHWQFFYLRGICLERSKQWEKAEVDLQKSLELFPEQPHVLNYLGYTWVDHGKNLDEGMKMIRRAVEQRPDDGYIVDSLGWAHYRLGEYDEAVKHLERAVELRPEDPTINDHLGDAYWRVGRNLEARFQWSHARDLKPEPDELKKIEDKLKVGLVEDGKSSADANETKKAGNGG